MLVEFYPRFHGRFSSLPLLGPHADGLVRWLHARGYPRLQIRLRVRKMPRADALLRRRGVRRIESLSKVQFLGLASRHAGDDVYLAALVRSLAQYIDAYGLFRRPAPTLSQQLVGVYRIHLAEVRGLVDATIAAHASTGSELLSFLGYDADADILRRLDSRKIEAFVAKVAARLSRDTLQHTIAHLRSFLRFLVGQGKIADGLDATIDTPRVYRGERLPRSLPWKTVQAFLTAINRSTPKGRRDYAMFMLIATYGLRTSEVTALQLDDIEWRADRIRVPRPKMQAPIVLPLTKEVGAAIAAYLRLGRPDLPYREVFLRARSPAGPLARTGVTNAFQWWCRRTGVPIPYQGPHCLRHSLAVHLLRQGVSLKAIGDVLGHSSSESTCVYLRLHVEDLRDVALEIPSEVRS